MSRPLVSVVIPCRNEARHIQQCLESVLASDYHRDRLDVIVVDGMSEDGTREIVRAFAERESIIRLLDNPERITPVALNIGIAAARGEVVMRMDAHNAYPATYVSRLVHWLQDSGADNVGGSLEIRSANNSAMARAIAAGLAHPLGVGNSLFHLGVSKPRWVDTVPFGCYRRSVFARIGGFDEELIRNQDDEFNARLRQAGGRILLVPDVTSVYVARATLHQLWRMNYQYGLFKPLAVRKAGGAPTLRQLAPPSFVTALALCTAAGARVPWCGFALLLIILLYGASLLAASVQVGTSRGGGVAIRLPAVFCILHLSYGLGYLRGLLWLLPWRPRPAGATARIVPLTR